MRWPGFQQDDFVEWEVSPCYGMCASYRARLDRQGGVEFVGLMHTCAAGLHRRQIDLRQAEAVLAAADIALRGAVPEHEVIDASTLTITSHVAGRTRRLALSLSGAVVQSQVPRFLTEGKAMVLAPGWLPIWARFVDEPFCLGPHGEHMPYDPRLADSPG